MGLSLKKEKMVEYLENAKGQAENFRCMLWGTVFAKRSNFHDRSIVSKIMAFSPAPGVASSSLNNAFCYIGLTSQNLYVIALDAYNTSKITGTFTIPFANITSLNIRKSILGGSHTIEIGYGEFVSLTVKGISIGTDIKDQKERMAEFLSVMESWKERIQ